MAFVLLLGALKIVGAVVLWSVAQGRQQVAYPSVFPPWFHLLFLAAFAGTGAALLWTARTDRRARAFAVVLVSFGSIFVDPLLRHVLVTAQGLTARIAELLYATQVVAFTRQRCGCLPACSPPVNRDGLAGSIRWPSPDFARSSEASRSW